MFKQRKQGTLIALALIPLLLSACGDDDRTGSTAPTSTPVTKPEPEPIPSPVISSITTDLTDNLDPIAPNSSTTSIESPVYRVVNSPYFPATSLYFALGGENSQAPYLTVSPPHGVQSGTPALIDYQGTIELFRCDAATYTEQPRCDQSTVSYDPTTGKAELTLNQQAFTSIVVDDSETAVNNTITGQVIGTLSERPLNYLDIPKTSTGNLTINGNAIEIYTAMVEALSISLYLSDGSRLTLGKQDNGEYQFFTLTAPQRFGLSQTSGADSIKVTQTAEAITINLTQFTVKGQRILENGETQNESLVLNGQVAIRKDQVDLSINGSKIGSKVTYEPYTLISLNNSYKTTGFNIADVLIPTTVNVTTHKNHVIGVSVTQIDESDVFIYKCGGSTNCNGVSSSDHATRFKLDNTVLQPDLSNPVQRPTLSLSGTLVDSGR